MTHNWDVKAVIGKAIEEDKIPNLTVTIREGIVECEMEDLIVRHYCDNLRFDSEGKKESLLDALCETIQRHVNMCLEYEEETENYHLYIMDTREIRKLFKSAFDNMPETDIPDHASYGLCDVIGKLFGDKCGIQITVYNADLSHPNDMEIFSVELIDDPTM